MMDFVMGLFGIGLGIIEVFVAYLYYNSIVVLLGGDRKTSFRIIFSCIGILFVLTAVCTWVPGRFGYAVSIYDESLIILEDGAFFINLAIVFFVEAFAIFVGLLKYLWSSLRKKTVFDIRFVGLEVLYIGASVFAGLIFKKNDRVYEVKGGNGFAYFIVLVVVTIALIFIVKGIMEDIKTKRNDKGETKEKDAAGSQQPTKADIKEFDRIVAEKNRLTKAGDYASQIPLLTKATGLNLDGPRKAKIWNYMGLAYWELNSPERSRECYQTALTFDPHNPGSLTNLARVEAESNNFRKAKEYMDQSIAEAKKRGMNLSSYYANYALICEKAGEKKNVQKYLQLASEAGYDRTKLEKIRRRAGL